MCGKEDDVANDGGAGTAEDEGGAAAGALGKNSNNDRKESSDGVGRDREELGLGGRVSQRCDDGGKEEGESVQGEAESVEG